METKYICWENGSPEGYTTLELMVEYEKGIDKLEYPTFDGWLHDMVKCGILIEEKDEV